MQVMRDLSYVGGEPKLEATLKQEFSDFQVDEELGFELAGEGDHLWLNVRKTDLSTTDVARRLAEGCGVKLKTIGYSGMKDRRGECTQWFSLPLTSQEEAKLVNVEGDGLVEVLQTQRNTRKLKIGSHKSNHFKILLRNCAGSRLDFDQRLDSVKALGAPNYFGLQRFGRNMSNMAQVEALMEQALKPEADVIALRGQMGRVKRGMLFSAARSYVFNHLLSKRIRDGNWNSYVAGDVLNLNGTSRFFAPREPEVWDSELQRRLEEFDIHISGPLAGKKDSKDRYASSSEAADMEEVVLKEFELLVKGLAHFDVLASRRSLRFLPVDLSWNWPDTDTSDLLIEFKLPRGTYATSLLREICLTG
ncbi:MAG TPA: tRNA pseudouridine(13) synthase TruD [Gammaproteobacteria bacterium]|nr:tRNA pseudouridine(13) synthase TruD [Gammaproteobacteria bacterium]